MDVFFRLIRIVAKPKYTEGVLFYKDEEICDTLEDTIRDATKSGHLTEPKIYGQTAIPYGIFKLSATYSPHFNKIMTSVADVPSFEGIRIHWGATAKNSEGCILAGEKTTDGRLKNTGMTDKITALVQAHELKGDKVYLEIV